MSRKIEQHFLVVEDSIRGYETRVSDLINQGYEPHGNMVYRNYNGDIRYLHLFLKYAEEDEEQLKGDRIKHNSALIMAQYVPLAIKENTNLENFAKNAVSAAIALEFQFDRIREIDMVSKGESKF